MQGLENKKFKFFNKLNVELRTGTKAENKYYRAKKLWLFEEKIELDDRGSENQVRSKKTDLKVRDPFELTRNYRRAAHQPRTLKVKKVSLHWNLFFS